MKLGSIDWDATCGGFQYKIGYCGCGAKVLASSEELTELVGEFGYMASRRRKIMKGLVLALLRRLA
jgi:hypothetical protein